MLIEQLTSHVRHAVRSLLRRPSFTVVATLTLALGIGSNTAIFSVVNAVLLKPLPYGNPERLVMVWRTAPLEGVLEGFSSYPDFRDWKEQATSFENLAAFWSFPNGNVNLTGGVEPERVPVARVMSNYFETLGIPPLLGRTFLPEENVVGNHRRAILSYALWQRQFGADSTIVGRPVTVNGFPYTVVGIMPAHFRPLSTLVLKNEVALWRPLAPDDNQTGGRASRNLRVVGRLAVGATMTQAQAELDGIAASLAEVYPETNGDSGVRLVPVTHQVLRDVRQLLLFLFGAVGLVLLATCFNVANLLLVKNANTRKQVAVQLALGAPRSRIIGGLLTESVMLGVLGATAGLAFAYVGVKGLVALGPQDFPLLGDAAINTSVLAFASAVALMTALTFGLLPAWRMSRTDSAMFLREGAGQTGTKSDRRLTGALVTAEVALATVLLVSSGLFVRSFTNLLRSEPGFDPTGVVTLQLELPMATTYPSQNDRDQFFDELLDRVNVVPGVRSVAMSNAAPMEERSSDYPFSIPSRRDDPALRAHYWLVSPDYFSVLDVPVRRGRGFEETDTRASRRVVLVSEALAHFVWGEEDPVGETMRLRGGEDAEIVGVVGDVRTNGLDGDLARTVYLPAAQWTFNFMTVVVKGGGHQLNLVPPIRDIIRAMDDQLPIYGVRTLNDLMGRSVAQQRFQTMLIGSFALLALALAVVGIYGVISYVVTDRTNELGLRMALGATAGDVRVLVLGLGVKYAAVGVVLGALMVAGLKRVTSQFLYGVSPFDPTTYIVMPLVLIAAAVMAAYLPARRATKLDPLRALRAE